MLARLGRLKGDSGGALVSSSYGFFFDLISSGRLPPALCDIYCGFIVISLGSLSAISSWIRFSLCCIVFQIDFVVDL